MAGVQVRNGEAGPSSESHKPLVFTSSASYKYRKKPPAVTISRAGSEVDDIVILLHGSDPIKVELNRLENELRDKDRDLGDAHAEIKAQKYSEPLKEKAVEEGEMQQLRDKLAVAERTAKAEAHLKAMEVESKKMRRDMSAMEKELAAIRMGKERDQRAQQVLAPRGAVSGTRSVLQ